MQNYKRVKLKILESTKPLITSNYIYTDSSLYTNTLTLQKSVDIQHMSELHNELLYINDNTLFSLQNGLIATLDSEITHFSSNEYLAIGTKTETLILDSNYETHQVFNSKIDKIVWYKNKYTYIENDNVVINNTKHKGKDALFLDYYNLFAILDDEIYFVEPNGLVHNEPINIDGYDALFSFHDTFVAAKEGMYSIYTFENHEWRYTNYKINGKVIAVIYNCIYTHEDGYLYKNIAQPSIDIMNDKLYRMGNDTLQITNFRNGCVPTPYWHERLNVKGIEMFSAYEDIVMIYANDSFYFIELENQNLVQKILLTDILRNANSSIIDKLDSMTLESVFVNDIAILRNEAYILINNEHLICYNYASQNTKSTKIPHAHLLCVSSDHLYLRTDNSIIDYDSLSETIANISIEDAIKFDVTDKFIIYLTKDTLTLKTLSHHNNLDVYTDAHIKSGNLDTQNTTSNCRTLSIDNVTSYICNNDYLAYIKNDHMAIIDLSTHLYQVYNKNEPYQTLLLMNDNLVSYIKRGNFESIKPRIFVRKLIVEHIKENRYREAFKLCEQNCINLDIFMNRKLHLREVLESTSSSAQTLNFVTQIYNRYNNTVHDKKTRCDLIDVFAKIDYKNDTYEMKTEALKFKYKLDEKRNGNDQTACCGSQKEFLDFVLKYIDDDICILKIYAKLNMLDRSMELIMKNNDHLKDLKTIVNDEEIIKQSLATYDLNFANRIIKNLQSDLYLDFIASIENKDAIEQRIKINKNIDKKETALFYIAQQDNPTDYILDNKLEHLCREFSEYVKTKNIESFSFLNCFDSIISEINDIGYARIYANFIYKKNKNESIPLFYDLQDYGRIFEIYLELKEYINACETNRKYIHDIGLYDTVICNIIKESNYAMVAFVNLKYKNDKDNAYVYFLKDKKYKDAETIKPLPDNYHESDTKEISEGYERLDYLINRINDIKERRVEDCDMTMSFTSRRSSKSTKSKLRDKVGSRYEREWCMDQIRIVVENMLKIKQAYCEIGDDRLNDVFDIFRENYSKIIDAIFDREDEMFDPERPVIQRPNLEEI